MSCAAARSPRDCSLPPPDPNSKHHLSMGMLVLGGGSVLIAAINHVADGETNSILTSFDSPESPWMHAVFLSGPVDRRAFRYLQAGPLFSNAYAAKSLQAFRYLRPPTDPPGLNCGGLLWQMPGPASCRPTGLGRLGTLDARRICP